MLVNICLYISSFCFIFIISYSLYKEKFKAYFNPFFWISICSFAYITLPCLMVDKINLYYNWNISEENIIYTKLIVTFINIFWTMLKLKFGSIKMRPIYDFEVSWCLKKIWKIILLFVVFVFIYKVYNNELITLESYGVINENYSFKLKNISYLLVPISLMMFFSVKKNWVFFPNIIVAFMELCTGARTMSFIALLPIFLCNTLLNRKTYISIILLGVVLFLGLGMLRSSYVVRDKPFYLEAIGEFRETFITLPLMIDNEKIVDKGSWLDFLGTINGGLLPPPIRKFCFDNSVHPGIYMAKQIGRGYGLGSNYLINSIFYGGMPFLFVTLVIFAIIAYSGKLLISKLNYVNATVFITYFVLFTRLAVREGIYANYSLMLFVIVFYAFPIIILNVETRKSISLKSYEQIN